VPAGGLARSKAEAVAVAERVGLPVAIKAQAAQLTHKSDAGGVILNVRDAESLRAAWDTLHSNLARAAPDATLDGVLVEAMAGRGVEIVIGAKRDPRWGPLLVVGLGGIWIEALGDVRILPAEAGEGQIVEALLSLRGAKLLQGFRGAPAVDLKTIARTAQAIGRLIVEREDILEVEINPFVAFETGRGGLALDALLVTRSGVAPH
jgi:acetate---CoA ligase (ADP-forming)